MPNGELPEISYRYSRGLGGMTLNNKPAPIMIVGFEKGNKLGKIIPPGTVGKSGKPVTKEQLVVPPNLEQIIQSYEAESFYVPPEIYEAINMAVQASY